MIVTDLESGDESLILRRLNMCNEKEVTFCLYFVDNLCFLCYRSIILGVWVVVNLKAWKFWFFCLKIKAFWKFYYLCQLFILDGGGGGQWWWRWVVADSGGGGGWWLQWWWWTQEVVVGGGGWCMKLLYKLKDQTCNLLTKWVNGS